MLEEKAEPFIDWIDELEEQIKEGEIDLNDTEMFVKKVDNSMYDYIRWFPYHILEILSSLPKLNIGVT